MAHLNEASGGYAVMLLPRGQLWAWFVYGLDGVIQVTGDDADREAAWEAGLSSALSLGNALGRV